MGVQDYISEAEALSLTGISTKTLERFVEAGYLQKEADSDGITLFSKKELNDLFMFEKTSNGASASAVTINYNPWSTESKDSSAPITSITPAAETTIIKTDKTEAAADINRATLSDKAEIAPAPQETFFSPSEPSETEQQSPADTSSADNSVANTYALFGDSPNEQLNKLHRIITLQEKLLDAREDEIKDLKEQRSWLRTRVEKLEEKGDKDQLILLSETQVIRKLVNAQQQKRSPLRAALEWLGIVEEKNNLVHPAMIEMSKGGSEYANMRANPEKHGPVAGRTTH